MTGKVLVPKGPRVEAEKKAREAEEWMARAWDPPLPDWLRLRDDQLDAVAKIQAEYDRGSRVVFLDAPTGAGKTSVAELTRRMLGVRQGLYVCTTKSLQEQVARDFGYARVLKGRTNYTPTRLSSRQRDGFGGPRITCADCDRGPRDAPIEDQECTYCDVMACPYLNARLHAVNATVGVLNTSYLLTAANSGMPRDRNPWVGRELVVADECDLLEDELLGYVELRVGATWVARINGEVPKKGSHMTTIRAWLEEEVLPGLVALRKGLASDGSLEGRRDYNRCDQLVTDVRRVLERPEGWVRDGDEEQRGGQGLVLKPISVEDVGERFLWQHAEKWLCMSGTVVSADTMADNLGLTDAGVEWGVVEMPMRFAKENRRVVYAPLGTMTRKGQEAGAVDKVLTGITRVRDKHPDQNILIHTHTYKLAQDVAKHLRETGYEDGRPVFTYTSARDRDSSMAAFRIEATRGGAILVAPSMDRGVDLPGDLCRVQVIVKVPMASLGSRQVSERLRTPGGSDWYLANTVRTIMQSCGRAVRGVDDHAVTYILDAHFSKILADGKRRGMFPQWWLDGLELGRTKEFA